MMRSCEVEPGPLRDACRYFLDNRCCHSMNQNGCPLGLHEVRQELVEAVRKRIAAGEYHPDSLEGKMAYGLMVDRLIESGDLE